MAAPAAVVVTDAAGRRVDRGSVRVSGATISVDVGVSAPGRYTVAFRVVSADGHPVSEAVSFAFVPPGATPPPATAAQPGGSSSQTALVRTVGVVGLGLLLTLVLGVALVRALRTNRQAANIAERRAAERASLHGGDPR